MLSFYHKAYHFIVCNSRKWHKNIHVYFLGTWQKSCFSMTVWSLLVRYLYLTTNNWKKEVANARNSSQWLATELHPLPSKHLWMGIRTVVRVSACHVSVLISNHLTVYLWQRDVSKFLGELKWTEPYSRQAKFLVSTENYFHMRSPFLCYL